MNEKNIAKTDAKMSTLLQNGYLLKVTGFSREINSPLLL